MTIGGNHEKDDMSHKMGKVTHGPNWGPKGILIKHQRSQRSLQVANIGGSLDQPLGKRVDGLGGVMANGCRLFV